MRSLRFGIAYWRLRPTCCSPAARPRPSTRAAWPSVLAATACTSRNRRRTCWSDPTGVPPASRVTRMRPTPGRRATTCPDRRQAGSGPVSAAEGPWRGLRLDQERLLLRNDDRGRVHARPQHRGRDFSYDFDTTNTTRPAHLFVCKSRVHELPRPARRRPAQVRRHLRHRPQAGRGLADVVIGSGSYDTSLVPKAGESVAPTASSEDSATTRRASRSAASRLPWPRARTTDRSHHADPRGLRLHGRQYLGNWCATCHPKMHSSTKYVHPIDQSLGSGVAANYNAYVKSGDLTGKELTSFLSLVPFAEGTVTSRF